MHACVCLFAISTPKYMRVYSCKQTATKSGHSSFNLIHSVNVCAFSGWKVSTLLIQLVFPQKEGRRREEWEKKEKKNRYNSKILMAERRGKH